VLSVLAASTITLAHELLPCFRAETNHIKEYSKEVIWFAWSSLYTTYCACRRLLNCLQLLKCDELQQGSTSAFVISLIKSSGGVPVTAMMTRNWWTSSDTC